MSGVYGNMLLAFCEQRRAFTVYEMTATVNAGYERVENSEINITGILQNTGGKHLQNVNGNLAETALFELWTESEDLQGMFFDFAGDVYRIVSLNGWNFEGGFCRYSIEKVVGNNGESESEKPAWYSGGDISD